MISDSIVAHKILLASILVMAASEASAKPISVISIGNIPVYSLTPSIQWIETLPANSRMCIESEPITFKGGRFLQLLLEGQKVYTPLPVNRKIFAPDPAGDKSCMSQVASTALPASIPPTVQHAPQPAPNYVAPPTVAASGSAYTPTANDVRFASVYNFAAIVNAPVPYYKTGKDDVNFYSLDTTPPLGQFVANQHVCVSFVLPIVRGGKIASKVASILLPGSGSVKVLYSTETFIPDPPNNRGCEEAAGQYNLEQSQRTADAVTAKSSPGTSAQSPEQPPSEAAQAHSSVGSSGTVAGPLEDGYAAERRGDFQAAFLLLEPLARQGNAKAQFELGHMYHTGKGGVPQDYTKALEWFRKAADQGNADAQVNLGSMYYLGQVVPQDYVEAMKWYRKAADQGNAHAQELSLKLKEEMVKSTVPDLPDPPMQDPKEARAALSFLERDLTISTNFSGDSEPGLASLQSINGGFCHLRCGFHLAVGIGQGGVLASEVEFALSDINVDTIRYNMDGIGRAFLSFETSDGTPRFSSRSREMDMDQKVLSPWTEWEGADKGSCRAKGYKDSLERDMKALAYLAKSCGAKPSPF